MVKKPNLTAAMQKAVKQEVAEVQLKKELDKAVEPSKGDVPPSRVGKKAITGFFDPAVSKQLKQIRLEIFVYFIQSSKFSLMMAFSKLTWMLNFLPTSPRKALS